MVPYPEASAYFGVLCVTTQLEYRDATFERVDINFLLCYFSNHEERKILFFGSSRQMLHVDK